MASLIFNSTDQNQPAGGEPIPADDAALLIKRWIDWVGQTDFCLDADGQAVAAISFNRDSIQRIIGQPNNGGIRIYFGIEDAQGFPDGKPTLILKGIDDGAKDVGFLANNITPDAQAVQDEENGTSTKISTSKSSNPAVDDSPKALLLNHALRPR